MVYDDRLSRQLLAVPVIFVIAGAVIVGPVIPTAIASSHEPNGDYKADFNGDGNADLAVGVHQEDIGSYTNVGAVNVLYGATSEGISATIIPDQFFHEILPDIEGDPFNGDLFSFAMAVGDFNKDGFSDLAIGIPNYEVESLNAGAVSVLYGSSSGLSLTSTGDGTGRDDQLWSQDSDDIADTAEDGDRFGSSLAAGDFNDDGYSDLSIGVPGEGNADSGAVNIIYGSPSGLSATFVGDQLWSQNSADIRDSSEFNDFFGSSLTTGDFNDDGYDDLVVGVKEDFGSLGIADVGAVNIIYGSPSGLSATFVPDQFLHQNAAGIDGVSEDGDLFGSTLASADFNTDGYDDLAVGVSLEDSSSNNVQDSGIVQVIYGSESGLQTSSPKDQQWSQNSDHIEGTSEANDQFGSSLTTGDFNNDGYHDLAIGVIGESIRSVNRAGGLNIIYGSSAGLSPSSVGDDTGWDDQFWSQNSPNVEGVSDEGDAFGTALASNDFNNDGYDDLAIGVGGEDLGSIRSAGGANIIYGSSIGLSPVSVVDGTGRADQFLSQDSPDVEDIGELEDCFGCLAIV